MLRARSVGLAQVRGQAAIALQDRVVNQWLQEDGAPARSQHPRDLRDGDGQVQVMQDLFAQHRVERRVGEGQHLGRARQQASLGRALVGLSQPGQRDVEAGDTRAVKREA
jgi:hypothetical protein